MACAVPVLLSASGGVNVVASKGAASTLTKSGMRSVLSWKKESQYLVIANSSCRGYLPRRRRAPELYEAQH